MKSKLTVTKAISNFPNYLFQENKAENTMLAYKNDLLVFKNFLDSELNGKIRYINNITLVEIQQYKEYLLKNYSQNTAKRKFNALKVFFNYIEVIYKIENIVKHDKWGNKSSSPSNLPNILNAQDICNIQETVSSSKDKNKYRDLAIFQLLISCGMRGIEIRSLKWEDIDFYNSTIKIIRSKNHSVDTVKVSDSVIKSLSVYRGTLKDKSCENVFISKQTTTLSKTAFNDIIKKWVRLSGIESWAKVTPHTFRHTFITECTRNNMPTQKIIKYTGHRNPKSLNTYTHLSYKDTEDIANLMNRHIKNHNLYI